MLWQTHNQQNSNDDYTLSINICSLIFIQNNIGMEMWYYTLYHEVSWHSCGNQSSVIKLFINIDKLIKDVIY